VRIVGDGPDDLLAALAAGLTRELMIVSGGLGPTHDDRTVELLARASGRPLGLDAELSQRIEERSRAVAERMRRPYTGFADGVRKQATIPEGAIVAGLAGTAPALVLQLDHCIAVTLPGPPTELQALWPAVIETEPMQRLLERVRPPDRRVLRLYGVGESTVARALEAAGGEPDGVEVTICARDFEIHIDLFVDPGAEARAGELQAALLEPIGEYLFGTTEAGIEEVVLDLCRARGLTVATAESCTGGLVAAQLTSVPGSSDVFLGGIVAYSNAVKEAELGIPAELLRTHGAVSAETASAMAHGVCERLGADVGVSVTGIAGPGGGTDGKPVGLVHLCAAGAGGELAVEILVTGDRETVRRRATVAALHLLRKLVTET
jgi:nicotinamide-nucleotide amidase